MAFYNVMKLKSNGKFYPRAILVDKPFETDELADKLAQVSTVSRSDVYAVLKDLPLVMTDMMNAGRSVRLEGLGTFRYTIDAVKDGALKEEDVDDSYVKATRIRFVPEFQRKTRRGQVTRALSEGVRWVKYGGTVPSASAETADEGHADAGDGDTDEGI